MSFWKKGDLLLSPVAGTSVPLSSIPDEAFAQGILGVGFGVEPSAGEICAPIDGTVKNKG